MNTDLLRVLRSFAVGVFAATLVGCTVGQQKQPDVFGGHVAADTLLATYQNIDHPFVQRYLGEMIARLCAVLPKAYSFSSCRPGKLDVYVVVNPKVQALAPGGAAIFLSSGLFGRLRNEAELAFVLAHELAHYAYSHRAALAAESLSPRRAKLQRSFEFEADRFALGVVALAGYDPRAAQHAVAGILSRFSDLGVEGSTHPSVQERVAAAREALIASAWQPPGILDRREFRKCKAIVAMYR